MDYTKSDTFYRIPPDEPLTPRMRRREFEQAIGFTTGLSFDEVD